MYTFKGRLCGLICEECPEPLANVKVRLYRSRKNQNVVALAVANPKETLAILDEAAIKAKASSLLAETDTDSNGNFIFKLGEQEKYEGEAFEVDVYCPTVPRLKPGPRPPQPVQFTITTLQPLWRQTENGFIAAWEYCIPYRFWCYVRALFGAWTICGRVTDCQNRFPVQGVKVRAFDVDWLQDDELGSAITDGAGKFRIDYLTADFKKTPLSPLINIEHVSGPDLYFRIETPSGTPLLIEPRARGRDADRENVGNCFCVEFCLDVPPRKSQDTIPLFRKVGNYSVDPADGEFTSEGTTTVGNYAFTETIALRGLLPDGDAPDALEYRFRVAEYDAAGITVGPISDIEADKIEPTIIGALEYYNWNNVLNVWQLKSKDYWADHPGNPSVIINTTSGPLLPAVSLNVEVEPGGWIEVPRNNDFTFGGTGRFVGGNVELIRLNTKELNEEFFDLTTPAPALEAGEAVPAIKKSRKPKFKIFFEARHVGGAMVSSNDLEKIAISNTTYRQLRHPYWGGDDPVNLPAVVSLGIEELTATGAGCNDLLNEVHALFTAYHPYIGDTSVYFDGPTPPPPLPALLSLVPSPDGEAVSPPGGHLFDLSANPPCAYILWLRVWLRLTNGYTLVPPTPIYDHIAFCKS